MRISSHIFIALAIFLAPMLAAQRASAASTTTIRVEVEIDYGPAKKMGEKKTISIPEGSTVLDALMKVAPADQGLICCTGKDVEAIGGVKCDPESESWWLYDINGHKGPVSAFRLILVDGDKIRWYYTKLGTIMEKPAVEYREEKVKNGGSISGQVISKEDIAGLPDFPIHKNVEACEAGTKPHPCQRVYQGRNLSQAVAWLESVEKGKSWGSSSRKKSILDQKKCVFEPHLITARQWTELKLHNSDAVRHTVHAYDQEKKTIFNLAMGSRKSGSQIMLEKPGVLDIQCDAGHRWMRAHIFVAQNPYYAVTDSAGQFKLTDVPPGTYTLKVWHDLFGEKSRSVTVGKDGTVSEEFIFLPEEAKKVKT